jgi:ribosomal protein S18 acetylase RimI-like enzyme
MKFTIRKAGRAERDADLVAPLFDDYRRFYGKAADPERARAFIRDRLGAGESVIFVAESTGDGPAEALGFVQLFPSFTSVEARRLWVLNDLYVVSAARRHGVGRALMEAARQHAVLTGAKRLTLETMVENRAAWKLYESLGYVSQEESVRFYTLELDDPR